MRISVMEAAPSHDAPGCLVLDVRMPGMNGLDFQQRLDELGVRLPAIMMTTHPTLSISPNSRSRSARSAMMWTTYSAAARVPSALVINPNRLAVGR